MPPARSTCAFHCAIAPVSLGNKHERHHHPVGLRFEERCRLMHPVIGNSNRGPSEVVCKSPDAITSLSLAEGGSLEPLVLGFAQWHSDVAVIVTQRHRVEDDHHRLERSRTA